jgi:hypothetical protein
MMDNTTTNNIPNNDTLADMNATKAGFDAFINSVILASIDDLGYNALQDEGTLDWLAVTDLSIDALRHAIGAMPIKNSQPDARPAMRRIMESLDAKKELADVVVQFDQVELDNVAEPTAAELLDIDFDDVLENVIWNIDGA